MGYIDLYKHIKIIINKYIIVLIKSEGLYLAKGLPNKTFCWQKEKIKNKKINEEK